MWHCEADKAIKSTHGQKGQRGKTIKGNRIIDLRAEEEEEEIAMIGRRRLA